MCLLLQYCDSGLASRTVRLYAFLLAEMWPLRLQALYPKLCC